MDHLITTTPQDIINTILAICGAIITISAAFTVIYKAILKAKEPDKKQDERITKLEEDVGKINARLELGNKRFEHDTNRVDNMEINMKTAVVVIIETLQALTVHAIDGNNIDELKVAQKQLRNYLLDKKMKGEET